jgi:hypothetical protein
MLLLAVAGAFSGYWAARLYWRLKVLDKRRRQRQARALRTAT